MNPPPSPIQITSFIQGSIMKNTKFDKSNLPSRHVTEGPERVPLH